MDWICQSYRAETTNHDVLYEIKIIKECIGVVHTFWHSQQGMTEPQHHKTLQQQKVFKKILNQWKQKYHQWVTKGIPQNTRKMYPRNK